MVPPKPNPFSNAPNVWFVTQEAEMTSELPGVATTRVGEAGVSSERVLRSARGSELPRQLRASIRQRRSDREAVCSHTGNKPRGEACYGALGVVRLYVKRLSSLADTCAQLRR